MLFVFDLLQGADEGREIAIPSDSSETLRGIEHGRADPADEHRAPSPPLHVAGVGRDRAVEVLDRVRAAERPIQRARKAEALQRQRLFETLADRRRGSRVLALERDCELAKTTLRKLCVRALPRRRPEIVGQ